MAGDEVLVRFVLVNLGPGDFVANFSGDGVCALAPHGFGVQLTTAQGDPLAARVRGAEALSCILSERRLPPGGSFEVRAPLQLGVGPLDPGEYHVRGSYDPDGGAAPGASGIVSPAVPLSIAPRSSDEMGAYIESLAAELRAIGQDGDPRRNTEPARNNLIDRLAHTRDVRIVPVVIDSIWAGRRFPPAARRALEHAVPDKELARAALLEAARTRGLVDNQVTVTLRQLGATEAELVPLIESALSPESSATWHAGAAGAMSCSDQDPFAGRLAAIAQDPTTSARLQALTALARNRTEAGLAALRAGLDDPDPEIRRVTAEAIRNAYQARRHSTLRSRGRPLLPGDFDVALQR